MNHPTTLLTHAAAASLGLWLLLPICAPANNLQVHNVSFTNTIKDAGFTEISFDLSWENSWRASWTENETGAEPLTVTNWDAAWVFVKYRLRDGVNTNWQHVYLAAEGHVAPAGIILQPGATAGTNVGVLVYRSADGHGKLEIPRLRLRWDYTLFGLQDTSPLDISVQAIEMVYVPAGPFYVGSGGDETGSLTDGAWGGGAALPLRITSEAALELKQEAGYLWARALIQAGTLSNAYPKGYASFYCMKYELTQGQYTKYLNQLTAAQAAQRFPGYTGTDRQTIGGSWPQYTNAAPERVANFVNWPDLAAYLAWAGLRPMTELEFEKACRGIKQPLANEYPWGDTTYINQTGHIGTDGSGTETADPIDANSGALGPVRAGIFARPDSDRILSGASYWGIMQLGGNVNERVVSLGQAGWSFSGSQGAGFLGATGLALNEDWPANDTAAGSGFRGGSWSGYANQQRTSHREHATTANITRHKAYSGRGVRTAPPDF